mmetsp:Transcript_69511/g.155921  ORF Transcript_69511/g.155921 Transcript_69511/m.155921 type:complete len:211 (-) Transcript_69511:1512-2144(-)
MMLGNALSAACAKRHRSSANSPSFSAKAKQSSTTKHARLCLANAAKSERTTSMTWRRSLAPPQRTKAWMTCWPYSPLARAPASSMIVLCHGPASEVWQPQALRSSRITRWPDLCVAAKRVSSFAAKASATGLCAIATATGRPWVRAAAAKHLTYSARTKLPYLSAMRPRRLSRSVPSAARKVSATSPGGAVRSAAWTARHPCSSAERSSK